MASVDMSLNGKILLITGGASGIGLSLTKQAHDLGARIIVADIRTTPDFDTFSSGKESITYVQCDVTRWSDFNKIFEACEEKWNDVPDFYAICAGIFEPPFSNFWMDTEEDGYKSVEINVNHPIKLTRMAIKKSLGRGKKASICIIASIAGLGGNPVTPLYCATKFAVVGFVRAMARTEPLTGVKITAICPGVVHTPLFDDDKTKQFSVDHSTSLKPHQVASGMLDLLQEKDYGCGTVMELSGNGTRVVPEFNSEPPSEVIMMRERSAKDPVRVKTMLEPIVKKLESEKGTAN